MYFKNIADKNYCLVFFRMIRAIICFDRMH